MAALLFIDLLGVRSRWHAGGRLAAERAFGQLTRLVEKALQQENPGNMLDGAIEIDAAAIVCVSTEVAVSLGRGIYLGTFNRVGKEPDRRLWLRGAITPINRGIQLRAMTSMPTPGCGE